MEPSADPTFLRPEDLPFTFTPVEEGPGRPKRANVDILRTQLWVSIVMARSGMTLYGLEREFLPEQVKYNGSKVIRPRRWDRYWEGKMGLQDLPAEDNLVDRVEARFPGTAHWFRHPIWPALSHDPMTEAAIVQGLKTLEPAVRRAVLTNKYPDGRRRLYRVATFHEHTRLRLIQRGSFDALGAAVLMVRYSEVQSSPESRRQALKVYYALQSVIAAHAYLKGFYLRLFSLIDFYCRQ